jgi:DnaJ domain
MGFDPRQWPSAAAQPRRVTTNIDALLAENEALRREVLQLRRRLELLERPPARRGESWRGGGTAAAAEPPPPRVTAEQVQRWGEALSAQSGWRELRLGDAASGLQGLIADLNRRSFHPNLSLEQRLDRLAPGLGRDLQRALTGPPNRKHLAILAAFALYGLSASEWLDDDPQRVVAELRRRQQHLQQQSGRRAGRRTRSDQRHSDRQDTEAKAAGAESAADSAPADADPRRLAAYRQLGLEWGASRQAIKAAHRRLVKRHHPDMGGRAEDFHRINEAYQLLVA